MGPNDEFQLPAGYPVMPMADDHVSGRSSRWDPESEIVQMLLQENQADKEKLERRRIAEENLEALKLERAKKIEKGQIKTRVENSISVEELTEQFQNNIWQRQSLFVENNRQREMLQKGLGVEELLAQREQRLQVERERIRQIQSSRPVGPAVQPPKFVSTVLPPEYRPQQLNPPQRMSVFSSASTPLDLLLQPHPMLPDICQQGGLSNEILLEQNTSTEKGRQSRRSNGKVPCMGCGQDFPTQRSFEKHVCYSSRVYEPSAYDLGNPISGHQAERINPGGAFSQSLSLRQQTLAPVSTHNINNTGGFLDESLTSSEDTQANEMWHCFVCEREFVPGDLENLFGHDCTLCANRPSPFGIGDIPERWN